MEDNSLTVQKPIDRRLEKANDLPLGPPGVEADPTEYETKPKSEVVKKSSRRRSSSSNSPTPRKRRSSSRRRRSPSPRRYRGSPSNRRRYDGDNWYRSKRGRDRDSSRERERNRSRRSPSRERGSYRNKRRSRSYSPRRNDNSPTRPPPPPTMPVINQTTMQTTSAVRATNPQYAMMPNTIYGDTYADTAMYNQYNMPPPGQPPFVAAPNSYNMQPQAQYNANFATAWNGAESYVQQQWMQQAPPPVIPAVVPPPAPILSNVQQEVLSTNNNPVSTESNQRNSKDDAVALEAENHRGELKKQRVGYMRKMRGLVMELMEMRNGKNHNEENSKIKQQQLERKIGAIENVIDMLTNIIGDREEFEDKHGHERIGINNNFNTSTAVNKHERPKDVLERFKKALRATMTADGDDDKNIGANLAGFDSDSSESSSTSDSSNSSTSTSSSYAKKKATDDSDDESSSERLKTKAIESMRAKKAAAAAAAAAAHKNQRNDNCNYTFYDPETHWCRNCNVFPKTARDYLNHLHSTEHIHRETVETPWHDVIPQDSFPVLENVETKRVPVRGLMFLSPASSWFCKLCQFWIGDLHCASLHLKSQTHFRKYNEYIAQNPNFENEWEMERLKKRNENMHVLPPVENDYTISSSKAFLPGKQKRVSSTDDSDSSGNGLNLTRMPAKATKKLKLISEPKEVLEADSTVAPPPPPKISSFRAKSKESDTEDEMKKNRSRKASRELPPIISESEKKLLVQLKGKIKPTEEAEKKRERSKSREVERRRGSSERRKNSRSRSRSRHRRRSRSRSVSVGRARRNRKRSRSRGRRSVSRGREVGWNRNRRNFRRSRSRSLRRRSRSARRRRSRSYSRSRSISPLRVEKAIVKHSEFRPRVPEADKKKKEIKEKNESSKKSTVKQSSASACATNGNGGNKKLPFIGKMPVLNKKTTSGLEGGETSDRAMDPNQQAAAVAGGGMYGPMAMRPQAPTAAQIQMAMMEDVYGNAPPFHPDAGLMPMDYDDLMPDPVQYVNLMGPVPPPPPPRMGSKLEDGEADSDSDMLPPGIDAVEEEEEQIKEEAKPPPAPPSLEIEDKSLLPKDLEEALNIIFPGEKKEEDVETKKKDSTETIIITDEPVMQAEDLVKEGIHMMTSEDLNAITMDEASQMSMNEPLIFKSRNVEAIAAQAAETAEMVPPPPMEIPTPAVIPMPDGIPIPVEAAEKLNINSNIAAKDYDLDDIPRPPPSPTDSEKHRRQEALDDLALLGIDADDMAAQCM